MIKRGFIDPSIKIVLEIFNVVPNAYLCSTYRLLDYYLRKNEVVVDKHYTNMLTSGTYCIKLIFTIIFFCNRSSIQKQKTIFQETTMQITLFPLNLEEGIDAKGGLRQIGVTWARYG